MLSRKFSDYIFGGILLAILLVVVGIRSISLGAINGNIEDLESSNKTLNLRINNLEKLVEENKETQSDHLYELYHKVPNYYSYDELYFNILSQLYLVGINDTPEYNSEVIVNDDVTEVNIEGYDEIDNDFLVIDIEVSFNVLSLETVELFIEEIYNSEQVYLINSVQFNIPDDEEYVTVSISFYTFYNIEN